MNPGYEFCPRMGVLMTSTPSLDNIASKNLEEYAIAKIIEGDSTGSENRNFIDNNGNTISYNVFWIKNENEETIKVKRNGVE
jgi:hypothetical protein